MKYTINLVVGDWSGDGHQLTETISVKSNLMTEDIEIAHEIGCKKLKINFKNLCRNYEDSQVPKDVWQKFTKAGLTLKDLENNWTSVEDLEEMLEDEGCLVIGPEIFAALYLFLAKQGNHLFEYSILEDNPNVIKIGGYGLFS